MKKVYYEETLKPGETITVTDSYVRYCVNKNGNRVVEEHAPVKSITGVRIGVTYEYSFLRLVCCIIPLFVLAIQLFSIGAGYSYNPLNLLAVVISVLTALFFVPRKSVCIYAGSKCLICIPERKFRHNDPKQLLEAITAAMEENKD